MARRDPELREPAAGERDVRIELPVALVSALRPRREESEILQLARQARIDSGTLTQLAQVELVLRAAEDSRAPFLAIARNRRGQLLPDHAQRQELVTL